MEDKVQTPASPAAIKSAQRVLEVLEFFAARQAAATVMQVCLALGYPQSSTSVLLASLVSLGYLTRDGDTAQYFPTLRVMLLGTWMQDAIFSDGSLLARMEGLQRRTGAAVLVGLRQGIHVRFILSLHSDNPNSPRYPVGIVRPVCRSAAGKVLLSLLGDTEVARLARRANAEAAGPDHRVEVDALLAEIRSVRARGWAESVDYPAPGRVTLAVQVPPLPGQPSMAVAVGFRTEVLETRRAEMIRALKAASEGLHEARKPGAFRRDKVARQPK